MALKSSMKIVIADPSPGNRQYLKKMLSDIGFKNVLEAADGDIAWGHVDNLREEGQIELIISEWELPKTSGLDLLKKVKADDSLKKTKFLMITGEAAQQNVVIAVKSGVNNVMVRPFSANTLMEKIGKIFGQS